MQAVVGATVFDGVDLIGNATVVIEGPSIVSVEPGHVVPDGAEVIDASGRTLLPGLIDSHVHSFGTALQRAVIFGVTTVLDMHTDPVWAAAMRAEQRAGPVTDRADLFSAGFGATAPGGHGTQYGMEVPTLNGPEDAKGWIADRAAEGSDWIKILFEDGHSYRGRLNCLSDDTVAALVEAAHGAGLLVVVHPAGHRHARVAIDAGADGLAHFFLDEPASDEFIELLGATGSFVIPTLTVLESACGIASGVGLLDDPRLAPLLDPNEEGNVRLHFAVPPDRERLRVAMAGVRRARDLGVPLLAGSDAPNPGTTHGASIHRELELLVEAGLTPTEALRAATSTPADVFGLNDRGRIAAGRRADLVLVDGDPTADIAATRAIERVWKVGVTIDRDARRQEVAAARQGEDWQASQPPPPGSESGEVADFEDGQLAAKFGMLTPSTDGIAGGASTVEVVVVSPGAEGSAHAVELQGEIRPGAPFPWAGLMFQPGEAVMAPANLSRFSGLQFRGRSVREQRRVTVMSFRPGSQGPAGLYEVALDDQWRLVRLAWARIGAGIGSDIQAIVWSAGVTPGPFRIQLDDIAFVE